MVLFDTPAPFFTVLPLTPKHFKKKKKNQTKTKLNKIPLLSLTNTNRI